MQLNQKNKVELKQQQQEKNVITQLWFKYFPYWPVFLILLALSIVWAKYSLKKATPLYESKATILIKDEKKGIDDNKLIQEINQLSSKKIIENEIEVLQSRELMDEVVKDLHLYTQVFESIDGKKFVSVYKTSPLIIEALTPDTLLARADQQPFSYDKNNGRVSFDGKAYPVNAWVSTKYGILKFTPRTIQEVPAKGPFYFSLTNPKYVSTGILSNLTVSSASKLASVINLKLLDEIPQRSEDVLNGLISEYNNAAIKDKNKLASSTLGFVIERLDIVGKDLASIEGKLQQYKSNQGAVDISSQGQLFLESVNVNDRKLSDVTMQIAVLDQVENYVRSKDNTGGMVPSTVGVNDPLLSQLLDKLYEAELDYDKLKTTTGENNPLALSKAEQINKIKPSILENIRNQKKNLEASKLNLYSTNNRYSSMLNSIPKMEKDLLEISREQNIKSGIYNYLLQKKEELALAQASTVSDSRIIDRAQSSFSPVSPNPKKKYMMAVAMALALGLAIVTALEMLKRTILFRHEIEKFTSIPIIGEIVHEKSKSPLVIGEGKRTFVAEQFRKLRTSLPYIGMVGDRKKLMVTSNASGDGKSFIVANLGLSLAMVDKKVVVLEFDLSNPSLSEKLNVTTINKGLTDYLRGNAEPEEIIRRTDINDNLFVMPAGSLPENPSELIMSDRVPELMEFLTPLFDYIIIDTAPVGLLSDAYVLSSYCDATLYIIRHGHTSKVSVERIDANNKINELKNMAIVFNGVKSRGFGRNGYGYGYGYGYIHKEKEVKRKRIRKVKI
jgi:capsular exopolysaccharide synthesis family protein